jgi:hypothetical protein
MCAAGSGASLPPHRHRIVFRTLAGGVNRRGSEQRVMAGEAVIADGQRELMHAFRCLILIEAGERAFLWRVHRFAGRVPGE